MKAFWLAALLAPRAFAAGLGPVAVTVAALSDGGLESRAEFVVRAPRAVAWEVLTDFREQPRFLSTVRECRILRERGGSRLVRQAVRLEWFLFRRTFAATLRFTFKPTRRLAFEDEERGDYRGYSGEWALDDAPEGVRVRYRSEWSPRVEAPRFLLKAAAAKQLETHASELQAEILRRAATKVAAR